MLCGQSVRFYEAVLNLKLSVFECDEEKMAFFPDSEGNRLGLYSDL